MWSVSELLQESVWICLLLTVTILLEFFKPFYIVIKIISHQTINLWLPVMGSFKLLILFHFSTKVYCRINHSMVCCDDLSQCQGESCDLPPADKSSRCCLARGVCLFSQRMENPPAMNVALSQEAVARWYAKKRKQNYLTCVAREHSTSESKNWWAETRICCCWLEWPFPEESWVTEASHSRELTLSPSSTNKWPREWKVFCEICWTSLVKYATKDFLIDIFKWYLFLTVRLMQSPRVDFSEWQNELLKHSTDRNEFKD